MQLFSTLRVIIGEFKGKFYKLSKDELNKLQWRYNKENLENGIWGNNNSGMN
jgi:hypothetical protein